MLTGWRAETTPGGFLMISPCMAADRRRAEKGLIRGEEFATRISSNIRPQDPGGEAARLAAPREVVKMDVMNSPEESVVEPQSVPSRISVVLVEEAKVGGTQGVQCPRVDQDLRLLAGVAKPASVTVCEDSHLSPSVEGMLSSPDLAGKLFPVIPAGIPLPVGPVSPVGLRGMTSPSDLTSIGPLGPVTDPAGPVGLYVARDPVASYGMLSPCDSTSDPDQPVADGPVGPYVARGPVGSYGMLSPCDSTSDPNQPVADGPVGPYVTRGPVGSYGMLSPCDSDSDSDHLFADGPVGPYVTRGPVGSYGTSYPCDSDTPGPASQYVTDGPVGPYIARSLVGPCGMLSPCDFETAGPVGLYVADGPVDSCVPVGPVGLCGTSSP